MYVLTDLYTRISRTLLTNAYTRKVEIWKLSKKLFNKVFNIVLLIYLHVLQLKVQKLNFFFLLWKSKKKVKFFIIYIFVIKKFKNTCLISAKFLKCHNTKMKMIKLYVGIYLTYVIFRTLVYVKHFMKIKNIEHHVKSEILIQFKTCSKK